MVGCGDVHAHTTYTPSGRVHSPYGSSPHVVAGHESALLFFLPPSLLQGSE